MPAVAAGSVIDLMAVALVEPVLSAEAPDRVLYKAWEFRGECRVETADIDVIGDAIENLGTTARAIASRPVEMRHAEARDDPGPMQEVVNQRVDREQHGAGFYP
jgi:hypothetical protein